MTREGSEMRHEPVREEPLSFAAPVVGKPEATNVANALNSGWLTTGKCTAEFEDAIADLAGASHAVGTTNCTSALYLAFESLDVSGDVITTPMTFATTVSSAMMAGANPVLADVRPDTLTLDPTAVKEAITDRTEAIAPVHYAGQATDMDALREIAADHDLALVEDAAHGLGGYYKGEHLGTLGDAGCYSFYATKTITTGEGGMLVTDDDQLARDAGRRRIAGVDKTAWEREDDLQRNWYYDVVAPSMKYNMNDILASIGLAQLDRLDEFLSTRRRLAAELDDRLADIDGVEPLDVRDPDEHARHLYPVFVTGETDVTRDEFDRRLDAHGIETSVHYIPIHHHSAFEDIDRGNLSTADDAYDRLLCLPLHPQMDEGDVGDVVSAVDHSLA